MGDDLIKSKYKLKENLIFKYKHLHPLPSEKDLELFYQKKYFQELQKRKGTREAKLLNKKDKKVRLEELKWLQATYFTDRLEMFNKYLSPNRKKILDIGCGSGDFLEFTKKRNWNVVGIEPSRKAFEKAKEKNITIYNLSLKEFIAQRNRKENKFDAVNLSNVLEHVLKPKETILASKKILKPKGIISIQAPNEFNKLQLLAQKKLKKKQWWVAAPDHINYFNFKSLEKLLKFCGFEILLRTTDYPMELFLLIGENYVDNPEMGRLCHQKRINFELSISKELRQMLYNKLAELEIGRNCIIYARKI